MYNGGSGVCVELPGKLVYAAVPRVGAFHPILSRHTAVPGTWCIYHTSGNTCVGLCDEYYEYDTAVAFSFFFRLAGDKPDLLAGDNPFTCRSS